jgi:hypothetical protein
VCICQSGIFFKIFTRFHKEFLIFIFYLACWSSTYNNLLVIIIIFSRSPSTAGWRPLQSSYIPVCLEQSASTWLHTLLSIHHPIFHPVYLAFFHILSDIIPVFLAYICHPLFSLCVHYNFYTRSAISATLVMYSSYDLFLLYQTHIFPWFSVCTRSYVAFLNLASTFHIHTS